MKVDSNDPKLWSVIIFGQEWSPLTTDDFTVWTSKQQRPKPQADILNTFHTDYHFLEHVIEHVPNQAFINWIGSSHGP